MERLDIGKTKIREISTVSLGCLKILVIDDTDVENIEVSNLKSLEKLSIQGTRITHLDLTKMLKITRVRGCTDSGRVVLTAEGVKRSD